MHICKHNTLYCIYVKRPRHIGILLRSMLQRGQWQHGAVREDWIGNANLKITSSPWLALLHVYVVKYFCARAEAR